MGFFNRRPAMARVPVRLQDSAWMNAKAIQDEMPLYIRRNTSMAAGAPWVGFGYEIAATIFFNSAGANGMPEDEAELTAVDEIEDAIKERLEANGTAALALVLTSRGARDLFFYASDPKGAVAEWEQRLQPRLRTHRVEFRVRPDAAWSMYQDFS